MKQYVVGGVVVFAIFVVGFAIAMHLGTGAGNSPKNVSVVTDASHATFTYLVPGDTANWQMSGQKPEFDQTKGVVSYEVHNPQNNTDVTISQQTMPPALASQKSSAFTQFVASSNVTSSQKAGNGTLYFRAGQTVGGQSSGVSTVIYMTPSILMFGAAGSPLSSASWATLMASMQLN